MSWLLAVRGRYATSCVGILLSFTAGLALPAGVWLEAREQSPLTLNPYAILAERPPEEKASSPAAEFLEGAVVYYVKGSNREMAMIQKVDRTLDPPAYTVVVRRADRTN